MKRLLKYTCFSLLFLSASLPLLAINSREPKKVVIVSYEDVVAIKKDMAIAQEILALLWQEPALRTKIFALLNLIFDKKVSISELLQQYPSLRKYEHILYKLATLENPLPDTIELLKQLKDQGTKLVLITGWSDDILTYMMANNPELFNLFDLHYLENNANGKKNEVQFYKRMRNTLNKQLQTTYANTMLFVDSNKAHTDAALKAGNIDPHLFIGSAELKDALYYKAYLS